MAEVMNQAALKNALQEWLPGWEESKGGKAIAKSFKFADFRAAMAFMNAVADDAEEMNHHPDWSNSYNTVDVQLSTHDAGGVTERDLALARAMESKAPAGQ